MKKNPLSVWLLLCLPLVCLALLLSSGPEVDAETYGVHSTTREIRAYAPVRAQVTTQPAYPILRLPTDVPADAGWTFGNGTTVGSGYTLAASADYTTYRAAAQAMTLGNEAGVIGYRPFACYTCQEGGGVWDLTDGAGNSEWILRVALRIETGSDEIANIHLRCVDSGAGRSDFYAYLSTWSKYTVEDGMVIVAEFGEADYTTNGACDFSVLESVQIQCYGLDTTSPYSDTFKFTILDVSFIPNYAKPPVIVTMDNCYSNAAKAWGIARTYGVPLTLAVPGSEINGAGYLTEAQLETMLRSDVPPDVVNHAWSHSSLAAMTPAAAVADVVRNQRWMIDHGMGAGSRILVPPVGYWSMDLYDALIGGDHIDAVRTWLASNSIGGGAGGTTRFLNDTVGNETNTNIRAMIDECVTDGKVCSIVWHQFAEHPTEADWVLVCQYIAELAQAGTITPMSFSEWVYGVRPARVTPTNQY